MSPPPLPPFGIHSADVLPWAGVLLAALAGFFSARFTAYAALQKTLLDASRNLVREAQSIHARDGARILELEAEIRRQRGEMNQCLQKVQSLTRLLEDK